MGSMYERLGGRVDRYGNSRRGHYYSETEMEKYERDWSRLMVDIWREKIAKLNISDTGGLRESFEELVRTGTVTTIEHRFMMYGLYVAAGVGNGFDIHKKIYQDKDGNIRRIGFNKGDLLFMGDSYYHWCSDRPSDQL